MPKIRILYIITKLELGGAQKQLLALSKSLDKNKFSLYLFTARSGLLVDEAEKIDELNIYLSSFLNRPLNPINDFLAFLEMCRFIILNKINIVHTHSSKAGIIGRLAARVAGVKTIIHTVHGWSFNDFQFPLLRKFYILLERICACITSKIIVVSKYDKVKGLSNLIGKENQYAIIPYAINHVEFREQSRALRDEFGILPSDLLVGMIACFKPQKSPQDFIELARLTAARFENVKFIMIGDGQLHGRLQKLIANYKLQDKVILAGWRRDIPQVLSALDIFVLTSLYEGLPISVLEAMASAKAVVVTNTGGISEVIKDRENGFLVEPRGVQELTAKVFSLLNDAALRKKLGENARFSLAKSFSPPAMVLAYQQVYLGNAS